MEQVNSWQSTNPGYVHKMHDDNDIEERVKTLHPELLPAYEQVSSPTLLSATHFLIQIRQVLVWSR